jgi:hypothetical protein
MEMRVSHTQVRTVRTVLFEKDNRRRALRWPLNELGPQKDLLQFTRKILANPELHSLPGWRSVDAAIDFLKAEAASDVRAGSARLQSLLVSAGVALV